MKAGFTERRAEVVPMLRAYVYVCSLFVNGGLCKRERREKLFVRIYFLNF